MPAPGVSVLDSSRAAFMQQGVSVLIASSDGDRRPCACRAVGCHVRKDGRVLVFLDAIRGRRVLEAIAVSGAVAVVFNEPPTHRSIQVKGSDATVVSGEGHHKASSTYADAFAQTLTGLGYAETMARELVRVEPSNLRAVLFTPTAAYDQTPGPGAGAAIAASE